MIDAEPDGRVDVEFVELGGVYPADFGGLVARARLSADGSGAEACGTYLIAEGVDLRTVMEVLGHSTFRLTMDTYAHVLDGQLHTAADAMDRAFGEE